MRTGLKQTSHKLIRTGVIAATAGALLLGGATVPAFAADDVVVGVATEATHPSAAQNVKATLNGKTITVTWDKAPGFTSSYRVTLKKDGRIVRQSYSKATSVQFTEPQSQGDGSYEVSIDAMDRFETFEEPGSKVVLQPIVIPTPQPPAAEPTDPPAGGEGSTPGGAEPSDPATPGTSEPGSGEGGSTQPGAGGETPAPETPEAPKPADEVPAGAPSAPQDVLVNIYDDSALVVNFLRPEKSGDSAVNGYVVRVTPKGEQPIIKEVTSQQELRNLQTEVRNLTPGKTYLVEVAAKNAKGTGPYKAAKFGEVTLSPTPKPGFTVAVPAGQQLGALNPSAPTTFTVAGTGYTGDAASKYGVDVVIADAEWWEPGTFPVSDFVKTVHITPAQLNNGSFTAEITLDPAADKVDLGKEYLVGTLAAGDAKYSERRLDKGSEFEFAPVAPKNVTITKNGEKSVQVNWDKVTTDKRITSYYVQLFKVENGREVYQTFTERGKALNSAVFNNLGAGEYRATVVSQIDTAEWSATPRRSAVVRSAESVVLGKQQQPETPAGPAITSTVTARLAKGNATAIELFWFAPEGKITGYEIVLTGSNGDEKTVQSTDAANLDEYVKFEGLTPGVTYTAKVRAQNADGWGEWSKPSNSVTIPADQEAFALTPPSEVNVLVDEQTASAVVQWDRSGYEPADAAWHVRISCAADCAPSFKNRLENLSITSEYWNVKNLPQGSYIASLKLVRGAHESEIISSAPFNIGKPTVVPNPQITATPTKNIDPAVENTIKVTGSGFVGGSATNGVYVVVADPSVWVPGNAPTTSQTSRFAAAEWVRPHQLQNGSFTVTVTVPAGALDPNKSYVIGTMAAHGLAITDRTLDTGVAIALKNQATDPTQPGQPAPQPEQPAEVKITATKDGKPVNSFTVGEAVTIDLAVEGAADGAKYRVALHSDPVALGEVVVNKGAAKLVVSAEQAAKFVAGDHELRFYSASDAAAKPIVLPWKVAAAVLPALPTEPAKPAPAAPAAPGAPAADQPAGDGAKQPAAEKPAQQSGNAQGKQLAKTGAELTTVMFVGLLLLGGGAALLRVRKQAAK